MTARTSLKLIDGGAAAPPTWRDFPQQLIARSPFDKSQTASFRISTVDISKMLERNRRQPALDLWTYVLGRLPPLPNSGELDAILNGERLIGMAEAHACFRGVKRPIGSDGTGFDTVAYVSRPKYLCKYEVGLVCRGKLETLPPDILLVTHARLDHPQEGRYGSKALMGRHVRGVITHWNLVEADVVTTDLPRNFGDRYRKHLW